MAGAGARETARMGDRVALGGADKEGLEEREGERGRGAADADGANAEHRDRAKRPMTAKNHRRAIEDGNGAAML